MGNLHLVTGYKGEPHVTAADQGSFNAAVLGTGQYVLNIGGKLAATAQTNNSVRISDGDILMQGRHIRLNEGSYVDLAIETGTADYKRNDLIVARYTRDASTGIEDCNLVVIKGKATTGTPSDPSYTSGDILNDQAVLNDMPLYRIPLDGVNIQTPVQLFDTVGLSVKALDNSKQPKTNSLTAGTALADGDYFPFYDASASSNKKVLWSVIKSTLAKVFAPLTHSHAWSEVTGKPSSYTPSSHEHSAGDINSGILPFSRGGTGASSLGDAPDYAIIRRIKKDSGDHLWYTPTDNGAMYATSENGYPQFGTLPVAQGGTGATTAADARTKLGAAASGHGHSLAGDAITGTLPVSKGGTGATTADDARSKLGAAAEKHEHSATDINSGTLSSDRLPVVPMSKGGLGVGNDIVNAPANAILKRLKTGDYDQIFYERTGNGAFYATEQDGDPKFGTLPIAQGGTGATDAQGVVDNFGMTNPNLLDNWYFADPINQRGNTSYTGAGYCIDRWKRTQAGDETTIVNGGVKFDGSSSETRYFLQRLEKSLPSGTYTLSAKVKAVTASSVYPYIYLGTDDGSALGGVRLTGTGIFSVSITVTSGTVFRVQCTLPAGSSVTLESVKLEKGNVSTLANDPPPKKALELAKCQRFFERIKASGNNNLMLGTGIAGSSSLYVALKVAPKRISPQLTATDIANLRYGGAYLSSTPTDATITSASLTSGHFSLSLEGEVTSGQAYRFGVYAGTYIDLDSEYDL